MQKCAKKGNVLILCAGFRKAVKHNNVLQVVAEIVSSVNYIFTVEIITNTTVLLIHLAYEEGMFIERIYARTPLISLYSS